MSKSKSKSADIEPGEVSNISDGLQSQASGQQQPGHGPRDIKMKPFSRSENPDKTGQLWSKWKKELMTRFRLFRIDGIEDRVDAVNICGGELIRGLIDILSRIHRRVTARITMNLKKLSLN